MYGAVIFTVLFFILVWAGWEDERYRGNEWAAWANILYWGIWGAVLTAAFCAMAFVH